MLRHDRAAIHARAAEVGLPPFLVAARDEEHGGAVSGSAADDANADADTGGFDGGGIVNAVGDGAAVCSGGAGRGGADAVLGAVVGADGECGVWVDHAEEGPDCWIGVVVEFLGLDVDD